ncbi:phenylalanine--tRNA ligase subunit beta [bacterium]|nr:phenylalanine--tRNA ligase subunit beta [bacterium]
MKLTLSMLKDYVETNLDAQAIANHLTMTGFELEEITEVEGEPVLDINIMANRGDGASVLGLSRELLAKDPSSRPTELYTRATNRFPASDAHNRDIWAKTSVEIQTASCTRYAARVFENLHNGPSPEWLQRRLRQIGQRPISLLVDLTNYVMFEVGQPLHAFDLNTLAGERIIVRQAEAGEKLTTLDGTTHELQPHHMVIADADHAIALAGIMGGEPTEVSESTTRCLLESAHFVNTSVRRTRKELGLFTEASYRFERSVDPEGVVASLNRFTELYTEITGEKPVGGVIDVYPTAPQTHELTVFIRRASTLLGMDITVEQAQSYLENLGFTILGISPDSIEVQTPTWRIDILREEDLIEEIGRVHGYEKIPEALPIGSTPIGGPQGFELLTDQIREAALRSGFDQVVSHSLRDLHPLDSDFLSPSLGRGGGGVDDQQPSRIRVRQPHSPEMAYLRNSILPSLTDAQRKNNLDNIHIFEIGRIHSSEGEFTQIAFLSNGTFEEQSWRPTDQSTADFFTLKGTLEQIAHSVNLPIAFKRHTSDPRFHPTRCAKVILGNQDVGLIGQIHPLVAESSSLPATTVLAELTLDPLKHEVTGIPTYHSISRNPASRRDIAILIKKDVPFAEIEATILTAGGPDLERHWLFDVYEGKGVPDGFHSLAIALQFRRMNANLKDEESNALRDQVVTALTSLGATLR